jgi:uncharacterized membrane protein YgcG
MRIRALLVTLALGFVLPGAAAAAPPAVPTSDGVALYAFPDKGNRPSVVLEISPVEGAAEYAVECRQEDWTPDRWWTAVATSPSLWVQDLEYGESLECWFLASNAEGRTASGQWNVDIEVDLPVASKIRMSSSILPGQSYRVNWTERRRIPRWVPRTTYVTFLKTRNGIPVARTKVKDRLARSASLRIPTSVSPGTYFVCVTIENNAQGNSVIPASSCTKRTIAGSGGGSSSGGSSGGSGGGSSGGGGGGSSQGSTASIGPVQL